MDDTTPALRAAEWLLDRAASMPRRITWRLAELLAWVWYHVDRRHREIALRNLTIAWGSELSAAQREAICIGTFRHLARVILEIPYLRALKRENVNDYVTFSGLEHVQAAGKQGRGVLGLASHFGNWELMSVAFSLRCEPLHIVVRPLDMPFLDLLIERLRSRTGNRMIPKKGSVRQMLRVLRQGKVVAILGDQNVDWYDGVFVPFFKEIACTNKALAVLALRTGAPVVPVHNYRLPDGRYHTVFEPEVPLVRTGDMTSDIEENTARFNRVVEAYVRRHPDQWFWVHQRWKTRPYKPWPREAPR